MNRSGGRAELEVALARMQEKGLLPNVGDPEKRRNLAHAAQASGQAFDAETAVRRTEEIYETLTGSMSMGNRLVKNAQFRNNFMFRPFEPTRGEGSMIEGGGA